MLLKKADIEIPADILENWQEIANILADVLGIPAALIMRYADPCIEVLVASNNEGNPFHPGDKEPLLESGLCCETVIKTLDKLLIPDALVDGNWKISLDVKLDMISYIGFPILWPDKRPFGTICVLDSKSNGYSQTAEKLMLKFRSLIESQLEKIFTGNTIDEAQRLLTETNLLYHDLTSRIPVGVYALRINKSGKRVFEFLSLPMCKMFGVQEKDALADSNVVHDVIHPEDRPNLDEADRLAAQTLRPFQWEGRMIVRGEIQWIRVQSNPLKLSEDESLWSGIVIDITDEVLKNNKLKELASYDCLTNLPNRRLLNDRLNQSMAANRRSGYFGALMFLDLDNFKPLNDTHGHEVGDLLLIEVAHRLQNCIRSMDTVARIGGDEFVVMLSSLSIYADESAMQAKVIAEKIRSSLSAPYLLNRESDKITIEHHCTASIGIAMIDNETSQDELFKFADSAMYQAKESGRNMIRFATQVSQHTDPGRVSVAHLVQLVWHPSYASGNTIIDDQHRKLIDNCNNLLTAILAHQPTEEVAELLDLLITDTVQHFEDEECVIKRSAFPSSEDHAKIHMELIEKARELIVSFHAGCLSIGELFQFIAYDVVIKHMLREDCKFFAYLTESRT